MSTQTFTGTLVVQDCCNCGMTFGVPREFDRARHSDKASFCCPRGHWQAYVGKSDEQTAKDEKARADRAEQDAAWARARADRLAMERDAEARSARAYRGHVTRLRNRIANGVCPVQGCRRPFSNVKAHIESQHPEWAHDHKEALV